MTFTFHMLCLGFQGGVKSERQRDKKKKKGMNTNADLKFLSCKSEWIKLIHSKCLISVA